MSCQYACQPGPGKERITGARQPRAYGPRWPVQPLALPMIL